MADEDNSTNNENETNEEKQEAPKEEPKQEEMKKESGPKNMWKPIAIIMTILFIVVAGALVLSGTGITGAVVGTTLSEAEASDLAVEYIQDNLVSPEVDVQVSKVEKIGNFYQVSIELTAEGYSQEVASFISLDGRYFFPSGYDVTETTIVTTSTIEEIPQSDVPKAELFIWSYCPYGVQAQGPLAEVASLLGDSADFEAVLYYDGHGAYETQQNKIQACIQEVDPAKYWDYATGFVDNIYDTCGTSRDIDCDKDESVDLMDSLGIDSDAVLDCVDSKGEDLIAEHSDRAKGYGVTGSPSLVINGVRANTARTAEAYKTAICSAFNEAPEECDEVLSGEAATTSGSC